MTRAVSMASSLRRKDGPMLKQFFEFRSQEGWRYVRERVADAVVRIVASLLVLGVFYGVTRQLRDGDFEGTVHLTVIICAAGVLLALLIPTPWIEGHRASISRRCELCNAVVQLAAGVFLVVALGFWGNQLAENQLQVENRESAPQIEISRFFPSEDSEVYEVTSRKGMAYCVSLRKLERYNFRVNDEAYEVTMGLAVTPEDDGDYLDGESASIRFCHDAYSYDRDLLLADMADYIAEKTGAERPFVECSHVVMLSFFDCDNQRKEFEFAEDEDGVSLVRTDETRYIPENNLTSYVTSDGNIYERMRDLIDGVMRDSGY